MNQIMLDTMQELLKKLTAVRMTLSDEERAILDKMVVGAQLEVEAHGMARGPEEKMQRGADEVEAHRMATGPDELLWKDAPDEVEAHRMATGPEEKMQKGADEVEAHRMATGPEEKMQRRRR